VKRLLLLRHAKAVPADGSIADAARPLAPRGERDAQVMGDRLRARGPRPDLILTSPATRTLRTAQLVAAANEYRRDAIAVDARLYLASPREILAAVATVTRDVGTLLVVGHNPGLSELALQLAPEIDDEDLPTCGLVALEEPGDDWASVGTGQAHLAYYDFPKNPASPIKSR
jgi:phosphohistidine phosphatase